MPGVNEYLVQEAENLMLGQNGAEYVSDTLAHAIPAYAIQIIEDAVIAAIASDYTGNTLVGKTLLAGTTIFGNFTSLTLTSGSAVMYKEKV
jgi:hypothetical protein